MTVHVEGSEPGMPRCGEPAGETIPLNEALSPGGRHFDCVACHIALTGGQRHSGPEDQA